MYIQCCLERTSLQPWQRNKAVLTKKTYTKSTAKRRTSVALLMVMASSLLLPVPSCLAKGDPGNAAKKHPDWNIVPMLYVNSGTSFSSSELTPDAMQLCEQLHIREKIARLELLREQSRTQQSGDKTALEARLEILELRQELCETVEQTRMEIEYVRSAFSAEHAMQGEIHRAYLAQRDNRVLQNNIWSFRTNGVLWTIAEALSIPTYSHPRYSVSSGTIGILAGLVPTAFSMVALRQSTGGKFCREKAPNMFAKIFDYPVVPAVDYPPSVLNFLNSIPSGHKFGKSRLNLLIEQWIDDKNIHILSDRNSKSQLDLLTGTSEQHLTIDLLGDRLSMLSQLDALVALMNRPLLEVMLWVRGTKHS